MINHLADFNPINFEEEKIFLRIMTP